GHLRIGDFLGGELRSVCVNKARHNQATKVEHEAVGEAHHRHITELASCCAEESNRLVLPGFTCQLDEILGCCADIPVVDRHRNKNSICVFDFFRENSYVGVSIRLAAVTKRKWIVS